MTLPNTHTNGAAVDATPQNANEQYLDGRTSNIMGDQINAAAGIPATATSGTLAGNVDLAEDINDLNTMLTAMTGEANGTYSAWNVMTPVMGATPITATGVAGASGGKVTINAGGEIFMLGYNFQSLLVTALGTNNVAGGTEMATNSLYALRVKSGVPPSAGAAQFGVGGATPTSTAAHWELILLDASSRFTAASVSAVTSTTNFSLSCGGAMGARVKFLTGAALAGTEFQVPWDIGGVVYLPASLGGSPTVNDRCMVCLDQNSRRSAVEVGSYPSKYNDALVAIIATRAAGQTADVYYMPLLGGGYSFGRTVLTETDWSADILLDNTESNVALPTPPFPGLRMKAVRGMMALANSTTPTRIAVCPLSFGMGLDSSYELSGVMQPWIFSTGIHIAIVGSNVAISGFYPTKPSVGAGIPRNTANIASLAYDRCRVKLEVEWTT